jgi:hypothetical protein
MRAAKKNLKAQAIVDIAVVEKALRRWDPIGVLPGPGEDEWPKEEYTSYALHLLSMLAQGCDANDLQGHLARIRVDDMGLQPNPASDSEIAQQLVDWWRFKSKV